MGDYLPSSTAIAVLVAVLGALWALVQLALVSWTALVWWEIRRLRDRTDGIDNRLARIEGNIERRHP